MYLYIYIYNKYLTISILLSHIQYIFFVIFHSFPGIPAFKNNNKSSIKKNQQQIIIFNYLVFACYPAKFKGFFIDLN